MFNKLLYSESFSQTRTNLVALILRVGLGVIFLYHGIDKISAWGGGGASWVTRMYSSQPADTTSKPADAHQHITEIPVTLTFAGTQLAVAWGEFLGGLALLIGLLSRLAALGLIIIQIGAIYLVTAPRGFSLEKGGGYEYNLALLAMCIAIVFLGAGRWSVDWLETPRRRRLAAQAAVEKPPAPPLAGPHIPPVSQPVEQVTSGG